MTLAGGARRLMIIVDEAAMAQLNERFLGEQGSTDVLAGSPRRHGAHGAGTDTGLARDAPEAGELEG